MVSEAARAPEAEGVNDITMVHVPPAASEEPQVLFSVKSAGLAPVRAILEMLNAMLPVLSKVTASDELVISAGSFPKARLEGETVAVVPVLVPVPERLTLCGLPVALSVRVTAALRVPLAVGLKVTLIEQLAPAAIELPQVLVWAKSPGFVPVSAILVRVKAALPVLFRVMA
jgi:hypothetical protein